MHCLIITVWLTLSIELSVGVQKSGPFNFEVEKLARCDDEGTGEVVYGTKITRTWDGKHFYNDTIYIGKPIDQNYSLSVELQSWGNGGYRPRYMHYTFRGCEEIWKYFNDIYKHLETDGAKVEKCPIKPGNYSVKDFDMKFDFIFIAFRTMIYNKYKVINIFHYKGLKVGCIQVYGEVTPK